MIPILIPIGNYPFFVDICTKNIIETTKDVELIFLTTNTVSLELEKVLDKVKGENVKHLRCDRNFEDNKYIHLKLLDWAFYCGALPRIVYIQHADVIWLQKDWHQQISNFCENSDKFAYTIPYKASSKSDFKHVEYKFSISGKPILRTHDFAAVYDKDMFTKNNLTFLSGFIGQNVNVSNKLEKMISKNQIGWIKRGIPLKLGDEVDGSDLIALEIYANFPNKIAEVPSLSKLIHCWDLFAISKDIRRENSVLKIDRTFEKSKRALSSYSWLSSNLFEVNSSIFPWKYLKKIFPGCKKSNFCIALEKYIKIRDIETCTFGINKIIFKDLIYRGDISLI
jgi:hypothetical protein